MLELPLIWIVGDWQKVDVWTAPWVVQNEKSLIVSVRGDYPDNMKVCDLIIEDYTRWNKTMVHQVFDNEEANGVHMIPFSIHREDTLAWKFEKMGHYSIKAGYIEFMRSLNRATAPPSSEVDQKWQWIWTMDITLKVRLFLWNVMHGILPTCLNLISRSINVEPEFKHCEDPVESNEHGPKDCPGLADVWSNVSYYSCSNSAMVVEDWIAEIVATLEKRDRPRFACILWAIWFARNGLVFNNTTMSSDRILEWRYRMWMIM